MHLTPEVTDSTHPAETMQNPAAKKCLGEAVRKGMVNYIGISL